MIPIKLNHCKGIKIVWIGRSGKVSNEAGNINPDNSAHHNQKSGCHLTEREKRPGLM